MDLSGDWRLIDDPVTVTYASRTSEAVWADGVSVTYVQRNDVTKEDIEADGDLLGKEATVFHMWKAHLLGNVPKVGDKVSHLGKTWQARSVGELDRDGNGVQRYRVVTIRVKA